MRTELDKIVDPFKSYQKRSIRQFDSLLKDKDIVCISRKEDWYTIEYANGQKFNCRGLVVENSMIYY